MLRVYKDSRFRPLADEAMKRMTRSAPRATAISERFRSYVEGVVPKLERDVEVRVLNKLYHELKSEALRAELLNAYHRRKLDIVYDIEGQNVYTKELVGTEESVEAVIDYSATDIARVNYTTVGRMFRFELTDFLRHFPYANFGQNQFVERHLALSYDFSVYMGRAAFAIISHLRRLAAAREFIGTRRFEQVFLGVQTRTDLENYIYKDADVFLSIVFDLARDLRSVMAELRHDAALHHFIECSFFFDGIVMCLAWEMHRFELRNELLTRDQRRAMFRRLMKAVRQHPELQHFVQQKPDSFFELFGQFRVARGVSVNFTALAPLRARLPAPLGKFMPESFTAFTSNMLLWGRHGCGKSGVLYAVTMWAIESDWLVVKLPSARAVTQAPSRMRRDPDSRLYISEEFAQKLLVDIIQSNAKSIDREVQPHLYGFYSLAGVHAHEPPPVPDFYIPSRKTWFYATDRLLSEEERSEEAEHREELNTRLTDVLPRPQTLREIARFGVEQPLYATACLAELLEQAYASTEPVLIVIDDYNWLYRPSDFPSFRYVDMPGLNNRVPAYHLALARLFMRFDGHLIRNGFKLAATSDYSIPRHHFTPDKINFPTSVGQELHGADAEYFANFCAYCRDQNLDNTGETSPEFVPMVWMENQGNFAEVMKIFRYPDFRLDESV